jgi:hypothetical protein
MFEAEDIERIAARGMDIESIHRQIGNFRMGFPYIRLSRAATNGDGIITFSAGDQKFYEGFFKETSGQHRIVKFVPASGAASRMFKDLFEFRELYGNGSITYDDFLRDRGFNSVHHFITNLGKFAFFETLRNKMAADGLDIDSLIRKHDFISVIDYLLGETGLNYSNLPKALLFFHEYPDGPRVAAEEHMVEAAHYAKDDQGNSRLHFTVSPEHIAKFDERIAQVLSSYESRFRIKFDIRHSVQKKSTDTIAVDPENQPFRNADGSLLFRPAGHGALLENLNEIDADLIFIKNIDNIVPDRLKEQTYEYKRLIGGYLLYIRKTVYDFLEKLDRNQAGAGEILRMITFAEEKLYLRFPEGFSTFTVERQIPELIRKLNRPMRVCGMVKNEGEPGGGPFWVADNEGNLSLQIVESSQINMKDEKQKQVVDSSTHFNPVDLVCSIKNYRGNTFRLADYVDESTGFISTKSSGGKTLKAVELPGLWNGSMADWITVFVEVPVITFNPVKIVNDLLRPEHQP